jgi:hypothetical protein
MGRFRDLWASGKFTLKDQKEQTAYQAEQEGNNMFDDLSPEFAVPDSTKAIFDALKSRRGQETGRWLREVAGERPAQALVAAAPAANVFDEVVACMDSLFKEFGDLSYEFNKTAIGTELLITFERPNVIERKSDEVWYKPVTRIYQGRLTTRQWALIVKGEDKKISIVLVPAGMLLAITTGQDSNEGTTSFMELNRADNGTWAIAGETVPQHAIPHLAKELLGDLIRLSSGVMSESELFARAGEQPRLGENLAVGYQSAPAPAVPVAAAQADPNSSSIHDACDVVDAIVERELKRLYGETGTLRPNSVSAINIRKEISAVEAFRVKMMQAFTEYTRETQALTGAAPEPEAPQKFELLH